MPNNKYSHALVLSHYESHGLIGYDRPQTSRSSRNPVKSTLTSPRPLAQLSRSSHAITQRKPRDRIRIDASEQFPSSPPPPPASPTPPAQPLRRNSSSIETRIYAPESSPSPPPTQDHPIPLYFADQNLFPGERASSTNTEEDKSRQSIETQIYDPQPLQPPTCQTNWLSSSEVKARRRASQATPPNGSRPGSKEKASKRPGINTSQHSQSSSWTHPLHGNGPIDVQTSIPSHPPSPPATPDSDKSFGLETHLDRLDKLESKAPITPESRKRMGSETHAEDPKSMRSQAIATPDSGQSFGLETNLGHSGVTKSAPPIPERNLRRSPPSSSRNSSRAPSPTPRPPFDSAEPKHSKSFHSPTLSMTTQSSSGPSIKSSTSQLQSDPLRLTHSRSLQSTFSITTQLTSHASAELPTSGPQNVSVGPNTSRSLQSTFSITTLPSSGKSVTSSTSQAHIETMKATASKNLHFPNFSISTRPSTSEPPTSPKLQFHQGPLRPRESRSLHSPTFSIATRTSSLNATTSPPVLSRTSSMPSRALVEDDDLESLPSILDLGILPWEDLKSGPAIFRHNPPVDETPMSSRSSSFDSAVPPPIRRVPNCPMLPDTTPPKLSKTSRTPKKSRPSISSMLFSRPHTPKAILYSETVPGKLPTRVTVSRTGAPSIPALFPKYRGQFPPAQKSEMSQISEERNGRKMSQTSTGERKKLRRGVSQGVAERRRSWFKNE